MPAAVGVLPAAPAQEPGRFLSPPHPPLRLVPQSAYPGTDSQGEGIVTCNDSPNSQRGELAACHTGPEMLALHFRFIVCLHSLFTISMRKMITFLFLSSLTLGLLKGPK